MVVPNAFVRSAIINSDLEITIAGFSCRKCIRKKKRISEKSCSEGLEGQTRFFWIHWFTSKILKITYFLPAFNGFHANHIYTNRFHTHRFHTNRFHPYLNSERSRCFGNEVFLKKNPRSVYYQQHVFRPSFILNFERNNCEVFLFSFSSRTWNFVELFLFLACVNAKQRLCCTSQYISSIPTQWLTIWLMFVNHQESLKTWETKEVPKKGTHGIPYQFRVWLKVLKNARKCVNSKEVNK